MGKCRFCYAAYLWLAIKNKKTPETVSNALKTRVGWKLVLFTVSPRTVVVQLNKSRTLSMYFIWYYYTVFNILKQIRRLIPKGEIRPHLAYLTWREIHHWSSTETPSCLFVLETNKSASTGLSTGYFLSKCYSNNNLSICLKHLTMLRIFISICSHAYRVRRQVTWARGVRQTRGSDPWEMEQE